jgi:hypothetical protein
MAFILDRWADGALLSLDGEDMRIASPFLESELAKVNGNSSSHFSASAILPYIEG